MKNGSKPVVLCICRTGTAWKRKNAQVAFLSFFAFEVRDKLPKADIIKALIPTLAYAFITITLNICKVIEGPYPFLMVYSQPWYASVLWCIVILRIAGLLAVAVWGLHDFIWKRAGKQQNDLES